VREQFLVELTEDRLAQVSDLAELNRLFTAWVETVYHPAIHSETGTAPLRAWCEGVPDPLPRPSPAQLREAFLWSEYRTVTKTATVSLHANLYQVDELLVGRKVELVFDPFDLTEIEVRYGGRSFGAAVAFAQQAGRDGDAGLGVGQRVLGAVDEMVVAGGQDRVVLQRGEHRPPGGRTQLRAPAAADRVLPW